MKKEYYLVAALAVAAGVFFWKKSKDAATSAATAAAADKRLRDAAAAGYKVPEIPLPTLKVDIDSEPELQPVSDGLMPQFGKPLDVFKLPNQPLFDIHIQ